MGEFHLFHAYPPPEFKRSGRVPTLQVMTAPHACINALAEIGENFLDYMDSRTTSFFFFDRDGWKAAWRMARIIAKGNRPSFKALARESQSCGFLVSATYRHIEMEAV